MSWLNHFSAFESREVLDLIIIFNLSSDFRHTGHLVLYGTNQMFCHKLQSNFEI